jgi:hypothetical protein
MQHEEAVAYHFYKLIIINTTYHHEPSWHPLIHAIHRRCNDYIKNTIGAVTRAGVKLKQMMIWLNQQLLGINIKRKGIYTYTRGYAPYGLKGKPQLKLYLKAKGP